MSKKELKARMINGTQIRCWCPMCEQDSQRATIIAPWISPVGVLVCVYGVCEQCGKTMIDAPVPLRSGMMDRVEQHLLTKYPALWSKLPIGYSPVARVT